MKKKTQWNRRSTSTFFEKKIPTVELALKFSVEEQSSPARWRLGLRTCMANTLAAKGTLSSCVKQRNQIINSSLFYINLFAGVCVFAWPSRLSFDQIWTRFSFLQAKSLYICMKCIDSSPPCPQFYPAIFISIGSLFFNSILYIVCVCVCVCVFFL